MYFFYNSLWHTKAKFLESVTLACELSTCLFRGCCCARALTVVFSLTASALVLIVQRDEQEGLLTGIIVVNGLLCIRDIHRAQRGHAQQPLQGRRLLLYERRPQRSAPEKEREREVPASSLSLVRYYSVVVQLSDVTLLPLRNLIQLHAVGRETRRKHRQKHIFQKYLSATKLFFFFPEF